MKGLMNGISLFTGYAGIDLALKEYVRPIIYCDIEKYAQGILLSRMDDGSIPFAPVWNDVTTLDGTQFKGLVDIIYGGFPCQDISIAGKGAGLDGERSGLFSEIIRIAKEASPTFIFLENVPAIRTRGSVQVQEALASIGYDTRWTTLSASQVGANHKRERWFCLAYTNSSGLSKKGTKLKTTRSSREDSSMAEESMAEESMANSLCEGLEGQRQSERIQEEQSSLNCGGNIKSYPDSECERFMSWPRKGIQSEIKKTIGSNTDHFCFEGEAKRSDWWAIEPDVGRVANGIANRVDRIKALGNGVVPLQVKTAFEYLIGIEESIKLEKVLS